LYILNEAGICLFSFNFKEHIKMFQKDLFCGFITGISLFSAELNVNLGYSKKFGRLPSIPINKTFEILISYINSLVGIIVVEKKDIDKDMKSFLDECLQEFSLKYKSTLIDFDGDVEIYGGFQNEIIRIYNKMEIMSYQIPKLIEGGNRIHNLSEDYLAFIKEIDGQKSIKEITQKMGKTIDEIRTMISNILWEDLITLSQKVFDDDVFEPKRDLFYLIRTKDNDPEMEKASHSQSKLEVYRLLAAIDGFKSVHDLSEEFSHFTLQEIKYFVSYYLSQGNYLEKIDLYPQIISIGDEILEKMTTEDLVLAYSLENLCDGDLSIVDISKKTGFNTGEIKKTLDLLGKHVFYKKKYIK
jgi:hypothetical protein